MKYDKPYAEQVRAAILPHKVSDKLMPFRHPRGSWWKSIWLKSPRFSTFTTSRIHWSWWTVELEKARHLLKAMVVIRYLLGSRWCWCWIFMLPSDQQDWFWTHPFILALAAAVRVILAMLDLRPGWPFKTAAGQINSTDFLLLSWGSGKFGEESSRGKLLFAGNDQLISEFDLCKKKSWNKRKTIWNKIKLTHC